MRGLLEVLAESRDRVSRYRGRSLNEQNTKATLIEPVLRALGWDLEDLEVVQREHKARPRGEPRRLVLARRPHKANPGTARQRTRSASGRRREQWRHSSRRRP